MNRGGRTTPFIRKRLTVGIGRAAPTSSATAVCTSCWPGKASGSIIKSSSRIYREERLTVRKRGGRKRATRRRVPRCCSPGTATSAGRCCPSSRMHWPTAGGSASWRWCANDFSTSSASPSIVDTSLSGVRVSSGAGPHRRAAGPPPSCWSATCGTVAHLNMPLSCDLASMRTRQVELPSQR